MLDSTRKSLLILLCGTATGCNHSGNIIGMVDDVPFPLFIYLSSDNATERIAAGITTFTKNDLVADRMIIVFL